MIYYYSPRGPVRVDALSNCCGAKVVTSKDVPDNEVWVEDKNGFRVVISFKAEGAKYERD